MLLHHGSQLQLDTIYSPSSYVYFHLLLMGDKSHQVIEFEDITKTLSVDEINDVYEQL